MQRGSLIKEGKAKSLYETDEPGLIWVEYMDQATALNGKRKDHIAGKGVVNNKIDTILFNYLISEGIKTDYVETLSDTVQINRSVEIIPLEVIVRNYASGSLQKKFNLPYLQKLNQTVISYCYKSDELDDPVINASEALGLGFIQPGDSERIQELTLQINDLLIERFAQANLQLVDFKLEFGKLPNGEIILADEISPDNCRLVDLTTKESLDKDVFRKSTGDLVTVYEEVLKRLEQSEEKAHV